MNLGSPHFRKTSYRIEPGGLDLLVAWIAERRMPAERSLDRLGEFLAETDQLTRESQETEREERP
jgi:hypothetical protein